MSEERDSVRSYGARQPPVSPQSLNAQGSGTGTRAPKCTLRDGTLKSVAYSICITHLVESKVADSVVWGFARRWFVLGLDHGLAEKASGTRYEASRS
jgi:hypothetical protein